MAEHGGRQAHRPIADARQLPEGEVRQRLRSMQGRLRRACGVLALLIRHSHWGRGHTISISAEALAAIEATLPEGREAEVWQDVRDLIHRKVEDRYVNNEILRHSGDAHLAERYRAGQRIVRHSTLTIFCGPLRCAQCSHGMSAGKPIASLPRLPRSKRVFHRSMIRNRAHGLFGHSYGSPTLGFA
jgi:hypothetical protein